MEPTREAVEVVIAGHQASTPGQEFLEKHGALLEGVRVKLLVTAGTVRNSGPPVQASAVPGEDFIVLKIESGPELILSPENAALLLKATGGDAERSAAGLHCHVGAASRWQFADPGDAQRGFLSAAAAQIEWIAVLQSPVQGAAQWTGNQLARLIEEGVRECVFALRRDKFPETPEPLGRVPLREGGKPCLVLIHGTFVDTKRTFGELWERHSPSLDSVFDHYGDAVYALDHHTVSVSPIRNALTLARTLPPDACVHLLTHSRGGLVAEVLVRVAAPEFDLRKAQAWFADDARRYEEHRNDLAELRQIVAEKQLRFERTVRVACPARGTLLASGRLDAYLSVLRWLLEKAQGPIAGGLMRFICEVARCRADPASFAGLEAMMPGSPMVAWLNSPSAPLDSELLVLAGDSEGDSIWSWIKTMVADAFYWTDNDLVVQTRSMYGGGLRGGQGGKRARYRLMRGGDISHFSYFSNDIPVLAIRDALTSADASSWPPIGPLSWQGEDAGGERAASGARPSIGLKPAERPAVIIIPDFMGSRLFDEQEREVWPTQTPFGQLEELRLNRDGSGSHALHAKGFLESYYGELSVRLQETHVVHEYAYDWRKTLESQSAGLARLIREELSQRNQTLQPVRILAHGLGGLLLRVVQLTTPETWSAMMAREGARVLMLGVPQSGSWAPMQVLTGDNGLGDTLAAAGPLFHDAEIRKLLASMPGFIQMQAGLADPVLQLGMDRAWRRLYEDDVAAAQANSPWHKPCAWGIPTANALAAGIELRRRLDRQLPDLGADAGKLLIVTGHAHHTPDCFQLGRHGLQYQCAVDAGDGVVCLSNARLRAVRAWQAEVDHGDLPRYVTGFKAYVELLCSGSCTDLRALEPPEVQPEQRRGADARRLVVREACRPAHAFGDLSLPDRLSNVMNIVRRPELYTAPANRILQVQVLHGNLKFVKQPLLIGHYKAMSLSGSEAVVDPLLNGRMSDALHAGLYPEPIGTCHVFENRFCGKTESGRKADPRPMAVVVVGLGEEGKLNATHLAYSVRLGVLAYAQRLAEAAGTELADFELAATLIGSGGSGISLGNAALSIVQGVIDANQKLHEPAKRSGAGSWPAVSRLTLVEVYLDRATDAWRVLKMQSEATPERLRVEDELLLGEGRLRGPLESSYRGATYDFISALRMPGEDADHPMIAYQLDSKRARTEVRAQHAQGGLVADLVSNASNSTATDPQMGRTLFQLLVPIELEPYLASSSDMVIELDRSTAALPWELLDTDAGKKGWGARSALPWALNSKLIRKLRVERFRRDVVDATQEDNILVIGEPRCDANQYPPLPGARREAHAVSKVALAVSGGMPGERVVTLADNNDAQTIINALFARNYRIVHIAGHGKGGKHGGVVLSGVNTVLGSDEIRALRVVPELVFLNCCHLAKDNGISPLAQYDRAAFAASIAEELIRSGVRCVIAAGWAVEDVAAERFATTFYNTLFRGARFIDAVGKARYAAWEANRKGNTWAAYQCYGDPEWSWRRNTDAPPVAPAEEIGGISSAVNLILVLEGLATEADHAPSAELQRHAVRLDYLATSFGDRWGEQGEVADAFAKAYVAVQDRPRALQWFEKARAASDGGASLMTIELYAAQLCLPNSPPSDIRKAIGIVEKLLAVGETLARHTIMALAQRRLSMYHYEREEMDEATATLELALRHFDKAAKSTATEDKKYQYYPARAALGCILRGWLIAGERGLGPHEEEEWSARMQTAVGAVHSGLALQENFWSIVAQSELELIKAVRSLAVQSVHEEVMASFDDLHKRIGSARLWGYVHDEARFMLVPYNKLLVAKHARHAGHELEREAVAQLLRQLESFANLSGSDG